MAVPLTIDYQMEFPLALHVGDTELLCRERARVIPGRRLVCRGSWRGEDVYAKIFAAGRRAERDYLREMHGNAALRERGIAAPAPLYSDVLTEGTRVILYRTIDPAVGFEESWTRADGERRHQLLMDLIEVIARHHDTGVYQQDMHWGNFLISGETIHTLDGGEIKVTRGKVPRNVAFTNLALLLSQLGEEEEALARAAYLGYIALRAISDDAPPFERFLALIERTRRRKERRYLKKIFRASSAFASQRIGADYRVYPRHMASAELVALLASPDRHMQEGEIIKDGNTCTVVRVSADGRNLVVKRYNVKGRWHGLRNAFGHTRAARSWRSAHLFALHAIPTATPVALVERRDSPFARTSYFIMEEVAGTPALDWFHEPARTQDEMVAMAERVTRILASLARRQISHGDLKATNFLIRGDEVALIDLDSVRRHILDARFRRAFRRDLRRFMENWCDLPEVAALFRERVEALSELHSIG